MHGAKRSARLSIDPPGEAGGINASRWVVPPLRPAQGFTLDPRQRRRRRRRCGADPALPEEQQRRARRRALRAARARWWLLLAWLLSQIACTCAEVAGVIGFLKVSPISRAVGRSATAAAAYRAGIVIADERTGERHDYRRKAGVVWTGLVGWKGDAESLANAMEKAERRKDAKVGRDVIVALPADATPEQRRKLAEGFARWLFERHRTPAFVAIHEPGGAGDERNWHAHVLLATRATNDGESLGAKVRELDVAATSGEHIEAWRSRWGELVQMDMRSHARRATGVEPEPKVPRREQRDAMRAERRKVESMRELIARAENQVAMLNVKHAEQIAAEEAAQRQSREAEVQRARRERVASLKVRAEDLAQQLHQTACAMPIEPTREDVRAAAVRQLEWQRDQALRRLPAWRRKWPVLHSTELRAIARDLDAWRAMTPPVRARLAKLHAEQNGQVRTQVGTHQARVLELEGEIARVHLELAELNPPRTAPPVSAPHPNMVGQPGRVRTSPRGRFVALNEDEQHVQVPGAPRM